VIGFGSLKALARVALPIKVVVLTYLFVLFARHDDPNFELAKVRRSRGGVSFGWTSQSESHTKRDGTGSLDPRDDLQRSPSLLRASSALSYSSRIIIDIASCRRIAS
jgi:hypothetical protein